MSTRDGGPAFPGKRCIGHDVMNETPIYEHPSGMTLLDWFAGQALAGEMETGKPTFGDALVIAKRCYGFADAMLAERERRMKDKP